MTTKVPIELSSTPSIVDGGNATAITIDSSENVAIGVTSAYTGGKLSLNGGLVQPSGNQHVLGVFGTSGLQLIGTTGGDNIVGTMGSSEPLIFRTVSAERMRISSAGNVGINSTNPQTKFVVQHTDGQNGIEFSMGATESYIQSYNRNTNDYSDLSIAAETLRFRTNDNSERMRISSTGLVSIGTTTTDRELKVQKSGDHSIIAAVSGTSSLAGIVMGDTDDDDIGHILYNNSNNSMSFRTNTSDAVTISSGGGVGIANTSPSSKLHLGNSSFSGGIGFGIQNSSRFYTINTESGHLFVKDESAGSERLRLDSSGNFMHNTTTASTLFTIQGNTTADVLTIRSGSTANANVGVVVFRDGGAEFCGQITCNGSTNSVSYTTSSDARLKNILGKAKGLEIINQLNPIHFEWKKSGAKQDGLIAQEVEPIVPNAITYNEESDIYNMDYSKLVTPLIKAVQELYEQVDALQSEINNLKGE